DARFFLRQAWKRVITKFPFHTDAVCLLPDHIHCIWTLPEGDADYSVRWRRIKSIFSRQYRLKYGAILETDSTRAKKQELTIWQQRFWEHTIWDETDYENHFDYIHFNPVKHGYVQQVRDWPWSSFHRYVKQGVYSIHWGDQIEKSFEGINFGE
ncbi:MAG: transposase, partial [Gammaproteobacteria bacterium]|nr:transposase [Gammaproteobacteria bacterium]